MGGLLVEKSEIRFNRFFWGVFWEEKAKRQQQSMILLFWGGKKTTQISTGMLFSGFQASTTNMGLFSTFHLHLRKKKNSPTTVPPVDSLRPHGIGVKGVTVSAVLRLQYNHRLQGWPLWVGSTPHPGCNRGKWRFSSGFPILKMVHNPGGDWHPGWGVDLSYE